jgi:hypothetical protein
LLRIEWYRVAFEPNLAGFCHSPRLVQTLGRRVQEASGQELKADG